MTGPEDDAAPEGGKPDDREWVSTKDAIPMVKEAHGWKLSNQKKAVAWLTEQSVDDKVAFSNDPDNPEPVTDLAQFIEERCFGSAEMAARMGMFHSEGLWNRRQPNAAVKWLS